MSHSQVLNSIGNKFETLPTYQKGFHNEDDIKKMIYKPFGNTAMHSSLLGFGGAGLAHSNETFEAPEAIETIIAAVKSGINYIDTAPFYGQGKSEIILGQALKQIPRNTYYLATKVGRYGSDISHLFDFTAECTFKSVEESLLRLGVEYFDILQVHDLEFAPNTDIIVNETLPALQKIKESGKAKYIGITGYPLCKLKDVIEKSQVQIDSVLSYCRCTLFDDNLNNYVSYFKSRNVAIINAAALGMGLLTNRDPPDWHPASLEIKTACKNAAQHCKEKGVDISKLAFCHSLIQPDIHVNLVGMENKNMLRSNLDSLWNGLTDHEISVKQELKKYFKDCKQTHWENKEVEMYWEKMKSLSLN